MDDGNFPRLRYHKQYTDIENFKKYERSVCIAYELAIRSPEVINLINGCSEYPLFSKEHNKMSNVLSEKYHISTHSLYLDYHFFEDTHKNNFLLFDNKSKEGFIEDIPQEHNEKSTYYTKRTDLYQSCSSYSKKTTKDGSIESANVWINPVYSRPQLSKFSEVSPSINLDLSLPMNELTDFIERLKKEHTPNNKIFKSVSELLHDTSTTKQKLVYKNKRIADMFYIYDYVTHIKDEAEDYNIGLEEKLSDNSLDTYDKEEILKDVSKFTHAKTIISSGYYGDTLSSQLGNKSKRTIEDDYNHINNFIKKDVYKTLL